MKYLVRSLKYLVYFAVLFCIMVAIIVVATHHSIADAPNLFRKGSLFEIIAIFVVFAAIYPAFGFKKNRIVFNWDFESLHKYIFKTMKNAGYKLISEDDEKIVFRHKSGSIRFARMYEDSITFFIKERPVVVDGPFKDTQKLVNNIYYFHRQDNPEE